MRVLCLVVAIAACHDARPPPPPPPAPSPVPAPMQDLSGLWGAEQELGPALSGPLRLVREGERWVAEVAGKRVACALEHDELVAKFDTAALRVRVSGAEPRARWLQPDGKIAGRCDTRVVLAPAGRDAWTGTIAPVPDRTRFYLTIRSDNTAWGRETERNLGRFFGELRLEHDGDEVVFKSAKKEIAVPSLDIAIAMNGGAYNAGKAQMALRDQLVAKIAAAAKP